jgi:hypothetical protein
VPIAAKLGHSLTLAVMLLRQKSVLLIEAASSFDLVYSNTAVVAPYNNKHSP